MHAQGTCSTDGCESAASRKGMCRNCYSRAWYADNAERIRARRRRNPQGLTCQECGISFLGHGNAKRCRSCKDKRAQRQPRTPTACSTSGCDALTHARGMCKVHYSRWRTATSDAVKARNAARRFIGPHARVITCEDCGKREAKPPTGGKTTRCTDCQRKRDRALMRDRERERLANDAEYRAISYLRSARGRRRRRRAVFERDGWTCGICGRDVDPTLSHPHPMSASVDHILPLSLGGTDDRDNLQCSHLLCNITKGNRVEIAAA